MQTTTTVTENPQTEIEDKRRSTISELAEAERALEEDLPALNQEVEEAETGLIDAQVAWVAAIERKTASQQRKAVRGSALGQQRDRAHQFLKESAPPCIRAWQQSLALELQRTEAQSSRVVVRGGPVAAKFRVSLAERIQKLKQLLAAADELFYTCITESDAATRIEALNKTLPDVDVQG